MSLSILCRLSLSFCICCPEVTVTLLHPSAPSMSRLAVWRMRASLGLACAQATTFGTQVVGRPRSRPRAAARPRARAPSSGPGSLPAPPMDAAFSSLFSFFALSASARSRPRNGGELPAKHALTPGQDKAQHGRQQQPRAAQLGTNSVVALVDGLFSSGRSTISSLRHLVRGLMARIWCSLNYARMAGVKA